MKFNRKKFLLGGLVTLAGGVARGFTKSKSPTLDDATLPLPITVPKNSISEESTFHSFPVASASFRPTFSGGAYYMGSLWPKLTTPKEDALKYFWSEVPDEDEEDWD